MLPVYTVRRIARLVKSSYFAKHNKFTYFLACFYLLATSILKSNQSASIIGSSSTSAEDALDGDSLDFSKLLNALTLDDQTINIDDSRDSEISGRDEIMERLVPVIEVRLTVHTIFTI